MVVLALIMSTSATQGDAMKKKISLWCLVALLQCDLALAAESKALLELEQMYGQATEEKAATMPEIEQILQQIAKTQAKKLSDAESKKVALLTIRVLRHKYSLLESPNFQNNKGGRAFLEQAKKVATDWLSKHPKDVEMLFALVETQATMRESTQPSLERILAIAPSNAWVHFSMAGNFHREKNLPRAMQAIADAVRLEKNIEQQALFMENGAAIAQDAACPFTDDLHKLLAKVPDHHHDGADEAQKKSPQYQQVLRDMEKIRQDFLRLYVHKNCLPNKP